MVLVIIIKLQNETYLWQQHMDTFDGWTVTTIISEVIRLGSVLRIIRVFGVKSIQKCRLSEILKQSRILEGSGSEYFIWLNHYFIN